mmetsp:Transcript_55839/g.155694  ORF Transcript_55839/g.155694 Transcript_55839/m.155694 type:complete len:301 (+) Transcript_55839:355-1257(+)
MRDWLPGCIRDPDPGPRRRARHDCRVLPLFRLPCDTVCVQFGVQYSNHAAHAIVGGLDAATFGLLGVHGFCVSNPTSAPPLRIAHLCWRVPPRGRRQSLHVAFQTILAAARCEVRGLWRMPRLLLQCLVAPGHLQRQRFHDGGRADQWCIGDHAAFFHRKPLGERTGKCFVLFIGSVTTGTCIRHAFRTSEVLGRVVDWRVPVDDRSLQRDIFVFFILRALGRQCSRGWSSTALQLGFCPFLASCVWLGQERGFCRREVCLLRVGRPWACAVHDVTCGANCPTCESVVAGAHERQERSLP